MRPDQLVREKVVQNMQQREEGTCLASQNSPAGHFNELFY